MILRVSIQDLKEIRISIQDLKEIRIAWKCDAREKI